MEKLSNISEIKAWTEKNEKWLSIVFFVGGFIFDIFTLGRIDDKSNLISQILYLGLLTYILTADELFEKDYLLDKLRPYKELITHFSLGSLLSLYSLFYFKSASFYSSFLFLFAIIALLVINELPIFQKSHQFFKYIFWHVCIVSFFFISTPIVFGLTGRLNFFLAMGLYSALVFYPMKKFPIRRLKLDRWKINIVAPGIITVAFFLGSYLFNILPPIPLAISKIGIYHNVKVESLNYQLYSSTPSWKIWSNGDTHFEARPKDKVFVFFRLFAPTGIKEKVSIRWEKKTSKGWETSDLIPVEIVGGRTLGFRGYTYKNKWSPGDWRVKIETKEGLEIGRIGLTIVPDTTDSKREWQIDLES